MQIELPSAEYQELIALARATDAANRKVRAAVTELAQAAESDELWSPAKDARIRARRRLTAAIARAREALPA